MLWQSNGDDSVITLNLISARGCRTSDDDAIALSVDDGSVFYIGPLFYVHD